MQNLNPITSYPNRSSISSSMLGLKFDYVLAPSPNSKGNEVNKLNKLTKKSNLYFKLRVFGFYFLTSLSERKNTSANSYSPVLIHFLPHFYLNLSLLLTSHSQVKKLPKVTKATKMASKRKVHPSLTPSSSSSNQQDHHIDFFPPYEEVNLADLFNHVQLTDNDRIYIPSNPFNDDFIPFGSLSYLETNNIFHTPLSGYLSADEEENLLKNPPNSPEADHENLTPGISHLPILQSPNFSGPDSFAP